ncbi:NAD-dependent epimerase/dehydratase family protein [Pseudoroseomonas wenyumeiae]
MDGQGGSATALAAPPQQASKEEEAGGAWDHRIVAGTSQPHRHHPPARAGWRHDAMDAPRSSEGAVWNAFLSGGAGYVGSHVVLALLERGDEVVVLDDLRQGHRLAVRPARSWWSGTRRTATCCGS